MPKHQPIETIARGLAIHSGHALLCRSKEHGYHYLPGGHIEFSEPARIALAREIKEEIGVGCLVGPLLVTEEQIFEQRGTNRHELTLIFRIDRLELESPDPDSPPPVPSAEDDIEFVWADLASVGDLVIYPDSTRAWLASGGGLDDSDGPFLAGG
ncbi:MAG: NUDIX domain-containing protein [Planctomycetota bacterium]